MSIIPGHAPLLAGTARLPTLRDVAAWRRQHGRDALPGGVVRGDGATYREVACRTALNRVAGMPFDWTLNPYRGCTHGCHFCYARRYQSQLEMDPDDEFASVILVKANFADVLRRELRRKPRPGDRVALGTATDPYQPIEGDYRLTRRALAALAERPLRIDLVTRGPLIVRDIDVLADLSRKTDCSVSFSVPTTNAAAWRELEPGTAHPRQRLRALRRLVDAGINAGVLLAPIVPGISSAPARLEATVRACADHGARFIGAGLLHLESGARRHFLDFLEREHPELTAGYRRLYRGSHPAPDYAMRVHAVIAELRSRHAVAGRRSAGRAAAQQPARDAARRAWRQQRLDWSA